MLDELEKYYRSQGILATDFTCRSKAECSNGCHNTFNGPKSAAVSTGYEDGDLPRLLFVSQDRCPEVLDREERLPRSVRDGMENVNVCALPRNQHWFLTHELAWHILKCFDKYLTKDLTLERVKHYFAHTNAAKCCQNKRDKSPADWWLFENCRPYLDCEIRVLRPDIIVTQGKKARAGLEPIVDVREEIDELAFIVRFDGRSLFWLHTHHPSPRNRWRFYPQRDCNPESGTTGHCEGWRYYAEHIREFMDRPRRGSR